MEGTAFYLKWGNFMQIYVYSQAGPALNTFCHKIVKSLKNVEIS